MTIYTIFAEADGYLYSEDDASATDAADGVGNMDVSAHQDEGSIGGSSYLGSFGGGFVSEIFLSFDTSTVSGTISSAAMFLVPGSVSSDAGNLVAEARVRDWGATLTTADWVPFGSIGGLTSAGNLAEVDTTLEVYNEFTGGSLAANVNQSGSTRIFVAPDKLRTFAVDEPFDFSFYDRSSSGTTRDPKLVIETDAGGGGSGGRSWGTIMGLI